MKKKITAIAIVSLLLFTNFNIKENQRPARDRDLVPDGPTAIKIAEAIWLPILGESVYEDKPFTAESKGKYWLVTGTSHPGWFGGPPTIEIRKSDCKILFFLIPK
jgi:hypothetical protein